MAAHKHDLWTYLVAAVMLFAAVARFDSADNLRIWFEFFFRVGSLALFATYLFFDVNRWAGMLLMLGIVSHIYPGFTQASYISLNSLAIGCGLYALIVKKVKDTEFLMDIFCLAVIAMVIALTFQAFGKDPFRVFYGIKMVGENNEGLMSNRNETSAFIAINGIAFLRTKWRWFIPVVIMGLYFAQGLGGMLAFGLGTVFFAWCHGYRLWPIIGLIAALTAAYFIIEDLGMSNRFRVWKIGLYRWWADWTWLGCGIGNWKIQKDLPFLAMGKGVRVPYLDLHNSFIQGLVEMGPAFVVIIGGFFGSIFYRARPYLKDLSIPIAAIICIIVASSVNTMERMNAINAMFSIAWLAIYEIRINSIRGKDV